jgi:hypothetical protein
MMLHKGEAQHGGNGLHEQKKKDQGKIREE